MINKTETLLAAERKIFTFRLASQVFGIDMSVLTEIREWEEPTPLPGTPRHIRGVTNLRGTTVPIVDLSDRIGWAPTSLHPRSCIIVASTASGPVGFLVDEVADIVPVQESAIQPPPNVEMFEDRVIAGLVQISDNPRGGGSRQGRETTVTLLDLDALNVTRELLLVAEIEAGLGEMAA